MSKQYISYWIPTTKNIDFSLVSKDSNKNNISDNPSFTNNLHINIEEEMKTINIKMDNPPRSYKLTLEDSFANGILIYSMDSNDNCKTGILELQAYHHLKSFLHTHQAHNSEEDALLHGVFIDEKIFNSLIKDKDKLKTYIIKEYCKQYDEKFHGYYKNAREAHNPVTIAENYINKFFASAKASIRNITKAQRSIHKALYELNFAKYLATEDKEYQMIFDCHQVKLETLYKEYESCDDAIDIHYASNLFRYQVGITFIIFLYGIMHAVSPDNATLLKEIKKTRELLEQKNLPGKTEYFNPKTQYPKKDHFAK